MILTDHNRTRINWSGSAAEEIGLGDIIQGLQTAQINVKSLGAVGDGTTDDTEAIQTALNYAGEVIVPSGSEHAITSSLGEVYIPPGVYVITSPLLIYSDTRLHLAKDAVIKRKGSFDSMIRNGTGGVGGYNGDSNVVIDGGVWDANKDAYPSNVTAISFGHAKNVTLRNLVVKNVFGWHHVELNAVKNGRVLNCDFSDLDETTIGKEMIQLDLMASSAAFPWFGPYDNTPCNNILIKGCTFKNGARGIGGHTATAGFKHGNIRIIGCHFEDLRGEAVFSYDYENVIVTGNTFTNCWRGVVMNAIFNDCEGFVISDNVFLNLNLDTQGRGIAIIGKQAGVTCKNGVISGNHMRNIGRHGIGVDFGSKWAIKGNTVTNCGYSGIWYYNSKQGVIEGNIVTGCATTDATFHDIRIGDVPSTASTDCVLIGNVADKINISADRYIATGNNVSVSLTVSAGIGQLYNNYIATVWTP